MTIIEKRVAELEALNIEPTRRPDYDAFWSAAMEQVRSVPLNVQGGRVEFPWPRVEVRDLTFDGLDGTPIHTWLLLPPHAKDGPVPCIIHYHGATCSRGTPVSYSHWLLMGCAVIGFDFRMQGGMTGSKTGFRGGSNLHHGVLNVASEPISYYNYHVWTDGLRAIELALATPEIDSERICVQGGSQGGGAVLAMAGLHPAPNLCLSDVPYAWFEMYMERRLDSPVVTYLRDYPDDLDAVMNTLSYFDPLNQADRITCPVLVSVGLRDPVCVPEGAYAAYNRITAPKQMCLYPFGVHSGGGAVHTTRALAFLREHFLHAH